MAYLTDFSYRQLIDRIEIKDLEKIDLQFFKKNIYDNERIFYFFNQLELKKIFIEKIVLSGNESFILVHKEVPKREDNYKYILSIKGNVKYHKNNECSALFRGFKNFFMPESVVRLEEQDIEKHKELVDEIRKWFIENNYTIERYENGEINDTILTNHFNSIFPEKYNIDRISRSQREEGDYKWYVERKSKGPIEIEQKFDYTNFLKNIDDLIIKREMLCGSPTMQNLSKYDFLVDKEEYEIRTKIFERIDKGFLKMVDKIFLDNYGVKNLKIFWKKHLEIKSKATTILSEYFKWTYNYNIHTFKEVFLEDFNLKRCNLCYE